MNSSLSETLSVADDSELSLDSSTETPSGYVRSKPAVALLLCHLHASRASSTCLSCIVEIDAQVRFQMHTH